MLKINTNNHNIKKMEEDNGRTTPVPSDGTDNDDGNDESSKDDSEKSRKPIAIPKDMRKELGALNDSNLSDAGMVDVLRELLAKQMKEHKDLVSHTRELHKKVEAAARKAESQDGKIASTR